MRRKLGGPSWKEKAAQTELAKLKKSSSKYREDVVMEISQLHARVDDAEKRLAEVPREIVVAKTATLVEYQSSAKFRQVRDEGFEDGVRTFIITSGMSTHSGTYLSLGKQLGRWSLSSMHLWRPL